MAPAQHTTQPRTEQQQRLITSTLVRCLPDNVDMMATIIFLGSVKRFYKTVLKDVLMPFKRSYEGLSGLSASILIIIADNPNIHRTALREVLRPVYSATTISFNYTVLKKSGLIKTNKNNIINLTPEGHRYKTIFYKMYAKNLIKSREYVNK